MADIYLSSRTGQTVTAQLYDGATPVGTPISMTEIGSTGEYFCDVPSGTAAGKYLVLFLVAGQDIASGPLYWDGTAETMPGVPALGTPAQASALAALAASTQAEHDATQAAIAALPAPIQPPTPPSPAQNANAVRTELATELARIDVNVSSRSTLTAQDIPAGLTATQVRTELTPELARIDAAVSSRSTLTAQDIPAGLTAAGVWSHADRQLTVASGLTPSQEQALADLQTTVSTLLRAADYTTPPTASDIASQVELAILSEGDGQAVLQAIADKIGNENLSAAAVASAVWSATQRTLTTSSGLTTAQAQMLQDIFAALDGLPDPADTAAALLDGQVETGATVRGSLRLMNAFVAGKLSGAGSNVEKFRNLANTHDVIVSTNDANGNRRTVNINLNY